jgi:hypothetical protein
MANVVETIKLQFHLIYYQAAFFMRINCYIISCRLSPFSIMFKTLYPVLESHEMYMYVFIFISVVLKATLLKNQT